MIIKGTKGYPKPNPCYTNTEKNGKNGNYSKKAYSWTSTRTMYSSVDEEDTE